MASVGGAVSGAGQGAAVGSMFGPWGTAIGGAAGFLGSLFGGGRRLQTPMPGGGPPGFVPLNLIDAGVDGSYWVNPSSGHVVRWESGMNPGWRATGNDLSPDNTAEVRRRADQLSGAGGLGGFGGGAGGFGGMNPMLRQLLTAAGFQVPAEKDAQGNPIAGSETQAPWALPPEQKALIEQLFGEQLNLGRSDLEAARARGLAGVQTGQERGLQDLSTGEQRAIAALERNRQLGLEDIGQGQQRGTAALERTQQQGLQDLALREQFGVEQLGRQGIEQAGARGLRMTDTPITQGIATGREQLLAPLQQQRGVLQEATTRGLGEMTSDAERARQRLLENIGLSMSQGTADTAQARQRLLENMGIQRSDLETAYGRNLQGLESSVRGGQAGALLQAQQGGAAQDWQKRAQAMAILANLFGSQSHADLAQQMFAGQQQGAFGQYAPQGQQAAQWPGQLQAGGNFLGSLGGIFGGTGTGGQGPSPASSLWDWLKGIFSGGGGALGGQYT